MELFIFLVVVGLFAVSGIIQYFDEKKNGVSPEKKMMDARVSEAGVRLGAVLDHIDAKAAGRDVTKWW